MKSIRTMSWIVLGAILVGCAGIQVSSDYDRNTNFSGLKTYDWISPTQPKTGDPRLDNTLLDSRIRSAVENQLNLKGYQKATAGSPDFQLAYHASIEEKLNATTFDYYDYTYPSYYHPRYGFSGPIYTAFPASQTYVYEYEEGTLLLDMIDPKTKKLIWRGIAVGTVQSHATPEKREKRINQAVADMLRKFPPQ
jgi:hypothetical protein